MLKKLLKLLKFFTTGIIWTYLYAGFANFITIYFWKFNLFAQSSWQIVARYWNSGRAIASLSDFSFFFSLLILLIIWTWGLIFLSKKSYVKIFLFPIIWYNNLIIKRYGKDSPRIILKNLGAGHKQDINQLVAQKLQEKPTHTEKIDIRSSIKHKIESTKH